MATADASSSLSPHTLDRTHGEEKPLSTPPVAIICSGMSATKDIGLSGTALPEIVKDTVVQVSIFLLKYCDDRSD